MDKLGQRDKHGYYPSNLSNHLLFALRKNIAALHKNVERRTSNQKSGQDVHIRFDVGRSEPQMTATGSYDGNSALGDKHGKLHRFSLYRTL